MWKERPFRKREDRVRLSEGAPVYSRVAQLAVYRTVNAGYASSNLASGATMYLKLIG